MRRCCAALMMLVIALLCGCEKSRADGRRDGASLTSGAPAESITVRILTFNAFAVPFRSNVEAGLDRLGPAIAELDVDIVALQEVWQGGHARRIAARLAEAGLEHQRWYTSDAVFSFGSAGLVIASRFPIEEAGYTPFTMGTLPLLPWHPDWFSGKGLALLSLQTPVGPLRFATTHLHAAYSTNGYEAVRTAQMLEVVEGLAAHEDSALILAGDLNAQPHELPFRLLAESASLTPALADAQVDNILYRGGRRLDVQLQRVDTVLDRAILVDGVPQRLSDHDGVLAELEVARQPTTTRAAMAAGVGDPGPTLRAAVSLFEADRSSTAVLRWASIAVALVVIVLGLRLLRLGFGARGLVRLVWRFTGIALVLSAGWWLYLGTVFAPIYDAWLDTAQSRLAALQDHEPS